jgi:uncharacterized protein YjgD (DUF1641 family)
MQTTTVALSDIEILHAEVQRLNDSLRETRELMADLPPLGYLERLIEKLEAAAHIARHIAA